MCEKSDQVLILAQKEPKHRVVTSVFFFIAYPISVPKFLIFDSKSVTMLVPDPTKMAQPDP